VLRHSRLLRYCSMPLRRRRAGWTCLVPRTLRAHLAAFSGGKEKRVLHCHVTYMLEGATCTLHVPD
jgi:hypothetical protein